MEIEKNIFSLGGMLFKVVGFKTRTRDSLT